MSAKTLARIAIALAVLVFLWGASRILSHHSDSVGGWSVPAVTMAEADSIGIVNGQDTVTLRRHNADWTVNGWPVAGDQPMGLFKALGDTAGAELVGETAGVHQQLGVDSAGAARLRVYQGGNAALDLFLGKPGSGYPTVYARKASDPKTYMLHSNLGEMSKRALDDWRSKHIITLVTDSIQAAEIVRGRQTYGLTRGNDNHWTIRGTNPTDSAKVAQWIARFKDVEASGFATPAQADSVHFQRPKRRVVLQAGKGRVLADLAFDSTASAFWVKLAGDSVVYRMETWTVNDLVPADSALRATKPAKH